MATAEQRARAPDDFAHHRATLEAKRLGKEPPPIHDGQPQCGFFRRKAGGGYVAAGIWRDKERGLVCRVGSEMRDPVQEWSWLAGNNIEQDDAMHYFQHGSWRSASLRPEPAEAAGAGGEPAPPSGSGGPGVPTADGEVGTDHNQPPPPPDDPNERLLADADAAIEGAREWLRGKGVSGTVNNDEQQQVAANKIGTLRDLAGKLEKIHEREKAPHWERCKVLDAKYLTPVKALRKASEHLRELIGRYVAKKNAEIERQRLAAEEAQRKAEEAHARKAAAAEKKGRTPPPPPPPPPPAPAPISKVESMTGRAISVGTRPELEIASVAELLTHYVGVPVKDISVVDPRMPGVLEVWARSDWRQTGQCPPGCRIKQVPKAA